MREHPSWLIGVLGAATLAVAVVLLAACARIALEDEGGHGVAQIAAASRDAIRWRVENIRVAHDPSSGQTRWSYETVLENTSSEYAVHLVRLRRQAVNGLEIGGDGGAPVAVEEYWLDRLRADLFLAPRDVLRLRCAESVMDRFGPSTNRVSTGAYEVWRAYEGEARPTHGDVDFFPVTVDVRARFWLRGAPQEDVVRRDRAIEWIWIADQCIACRVPVYCQILPRETHDFAVATQPVIVVAVGMEGRAVWLRPGEAETRRVAVCMHWIPDEHPVAHDFWRCADGTDLGASRSAPFMVLQTSMKTRDVRIRHAGAWSVRICPFETEALDEQFSSDDPKFPTEPETCIDGPAFTVH